MERSPKTVGFISNLSFWKRPYRKHLERGGLLRKNLDGDRTKLVTVASSSWSFQRKLTAVQTEPGRWLVTLGSDQPKTLRVGVFPRSQTGDFSEPRKCDAALGWNFEVKGLPVRSQLY